MSVTPKKLTPKQIHTQERKKLVYMTAVNLFLTQGYDSTTIKDISTESGVSVGSIYHFYENKAAILMAYANRVLQNEALKYLEITDESLADPTRFILDYYCTMSSTFQKLGTDMTRHVQGTLNRRWFNPNGTINEDYVHTDLIRFVEATQKKGTFDNSLSPLEIVQQLLTISEGVLVTWFQQDGSFSLPDYLRNLLGRVLQSYMSCPERSGGIGENIHRP